MVAHVDSNSSQAVTTLNAPKKAGKTIDSSEDFASVESSKDNLPPQGVGSHLWLITFVLIAHLEIGAVFSVLILR